MSSKEDEEKKRIEKLIEGLTVTDPWLAQKAKENPLIQRLVSEDLELAKKVSNWCDEVKPDLEKIANNFRQYTGHGTEHSEAILTLLGWLIPPNMIEGMNAVEIALLVLAGYHHDIGMAWDVDRQEELMKTKDWLDSKDRLIGKFRDSQTIKDKTEQSLLNLAFIEWARGRHAEEAVHWIEEKRIGDHRYRITHLFDYDPWPEVKELCRIHTEPYCDELRIDEGVAGPSGKLVNMCFLGCALRLADECHVTLDRADEQIARFIRYTDDYSREKWEERQCIKSVSPLGQVLVINAEPRSPNLHRAVVEIGREIKEELEKTNRTLHRKRSRLCFPWLDVDWDSQVKGSNSYIYRDWEYSLDRSKVYDLLMGKNLYVDMSVCVRELLQNAVDAVRARWGKEAPERGKIICRRLVKNRDGKDFEVIEIEDNGIGMDEDIIENHLLKVPAESFYGTSRFKREHPDTSDVLITTAQHGIGFLSTFMVATTVEIFTWYDFFSPSKIPKPMHVELESLDKGIVYYYEPDMKDFPKGVCDGRGTCVRLWLTGKLTDWACSHKEGNWDSLREIVEYWARRIVIPLSIDESGQLIVKSGRSVVPPNVIMIQDEALGINGYVDMSVDYGSPEATDLQVTVLGFYVGRNPFRKEKLGLRFPKGELDFSGKRDFSLTVDRNDFQEIKSSETVTRAKSLLFEAAIKWIRQQQRNWGSDSKKKLRNLLLHNRVLGENEDLRNLISDLPIFRAGGEDFDQSINEILKKKTFFYLPILPRFRGDVWNSSIVARRFGKWYNEIVDKLRSENRLLLGGQIGQTLPTKSYLEFAARSKHRQRYPLHLLSWLCDARLEFTKEGWPLLRLLVRDDASPTPTHGWSPLLDYEPDKKDWLICSTDGEAYWINPYCSAKKDILGEEGKITGVNIDHYHGHQLAKRPADGFLYPYDKVAIFFDTNGKRQVVEKTVNDLGDLVCPFDQIDFWIQKFRNEVQLSEQDFDSLLRVLHLDSDPLF